MRIAAPALLALALACAGAPSGPAPAPQPGLGPGDVLALLHEGAHDESYRVRVEERFLSRIEDGIWREIGARELKSEPAGGEVRLAAVAHRSCSDWQFRSEEGVVSHQSEARASWFLLRGGELVAWDHWRFGPRCTPENDFRPAREADRETERTFLRFVAQRFPNPPPPPEIRFARGHAYLEAERLEDARRALAAGDRAVDAWLAAHEHHELDAEAQAAIDRREAELRRARADLSVALARALRAREGPPDDPIDRFVEGLD